VEELVEELVVVLVDVLVELLVVVVVLVEVVVVVVVAAAFNDGTHSSRRWISVRSSAPYWLLVGALSVPCGELSFDLYDRRWPGWLGGVGSSPFLFVGTHRRYGRRSVRLIDSN